jgi:hypothetical protein
VGKWALVLVVAGAGVAEGSASAVVVVDVAAGDHHRTQVEFVVNYAGR